MGSPDLQMLAQAVLGDETALTELLLHFGRIVRRELRIEPRWQSLVDADDVMQVTYLEAALQIRNFESGSLEGFLAWLRRIAENNLRDAIRALECDKRSQDRVESPRTDDSYATLVERLSAGSTTPSRAAGTRELQQFVEDALRKLPEAYEKVLRLCELECKTAMEAATILGRSHGAVRMLLARARDRLRDLLSKGPGLFSDTA